MSWNWSWTNEVNERVLEVSIDIAPDCNDVSRKDVLGRLTKQEMTRSPVFGR